MYHLNYETRPVNNAKFANYKSVKVTGFPAKISEEKIKSIFNDLSKPVTITNKGFNILENKAISKSKIFYPAYHQFFRSETLVFVKILEQILFQ